MIPREIGTVEGTAICCAPWLAEVAVVDDLTWFPPFFPRRERVAGRLTETEEEEVDKELMAVGLLPEKHLHHAHDLIQNSQTEPQETSALLPTPNSEFDHLVNCS